MNARGVLIILPKSEALVMPEFPSVQIACSCHLRYARVPSPDAVSTGSHRYGFDRRIVDERKRYMDDVRHTAAAPCLPIRPL